jgi:hypothetical protein
MDPQVGLAPPWHWPEGRGRIASTSAKGCGRRCAYAQDRTEISVLFANQTEGDILVRDMLDKWQVCCARGALSGCGPKRLAGGSGTIDNLHSRQRTCAQLPARAFGPGADCGGGVRCVMRRHAYGSIACAAARSHQHGHAAGRAPGALQGVVHPRPSAHSLGERRSRLRTPAAPCPCLRHFALLALGLGPQRSAPERRGWHG